MAITLDGTNGITTPAVTNNGAYTGDGISFADATPSNTLVTTTGGNVGIGTASPSHQLDVANGARAKYVQILNNGYAGSAATTPELYSPAAATLAFGAGGAERMRIDSSGNLLVGYTSGGASATGTVRAVGFNTKAGIGASLGANSFNINWTGSPQLWIDTTNIGTIQLSSDYRIKRNIETQTAPALERVMALRPVTYQMADYGDLFKAGDAIKEGFIAHEVQEVIPSGAEGVKDDPNQIQSLRVDAILAVAVKAIQELKAELDTVKTELATLKGTV